MLRGMMTDSNGNRPCVLVRRWREPGNASGEHRRARARDSPNSSSPPTSPPCANHHATCKLFMSSRVQGILTTEEERSTHVLPPSCTRMHGVFWLLGAALPGSWGHGFKGAGKMRSKERVTTMQSTCITVSYRWMATRKAAGTALVPHSCDRNLGHFKVQSNMQLC